MSTVTCYIGPYCSKYTILKGKNLWSRSLIANAICKHTHLVVVVQPRAWGMYYAEGYHRPTEADMQRLTTNDPNAESFP